MTDIDDHWLAANGGQAGPWILDRPGETYRLQCDPVAEGTGFIFAADSVTLDLNGRKLTYGAGNVVSATGFDYSGLTPGATEIPFWDLSGAPGASVVANTTWLDGANVLRFPEPGFIVSGPVVIPKAGLSYAATVPMSAPKGTQNAAPGVVTLSVVQADVTGPIFRGFDGGGDNADGSICEWVPEGPTAPVRVRIDVSRAGASPLPFTIDVGRVRLTPSRNYGVVAAHDYNMPGAGSVPQSYRNCVSPTVTNGTIVQGPNCSYGGHAVQALSAHGKVTVKGVKFTLTGDEACAVQAGMDEDSTAADTREVTDNSVSKGPGGMVVVRARNFAVFDFSNMRGDVVCERNQVHGGDQLGVVLSDHESVKTASHSVRDNEIAHRAVVTNGYAIALTGVKGAVVSGNVIDTYGPGLSGHGISLDNYDARTTENVEVFDNHVTVQSEGVPEYGQDMDARGLRVRNNANSGPPAGAFRNVKIHGNTVEAHTNTGQQLVCYGLRFSVLNIDGAGDDSGVTFWDNTFRAVVHTPDTSYEAVAVGFEGLDPKINPAFNGNVYESNHICIELTGPDGGAVNDLRVKGGRCVRNAALKRDDFAHVQAGWWDRQIHNVVLDAVQYDDGYEPVIRWGGTGGTYVGPGPYKDVSVWKPFTVSVQEGGVAQAGVSVMVSGPDAVIYASGMTGDAGAFVGSVPVVRYTQPGQGVDSIVKSGPTGYVLEVMKAGRPTVTRNLAASALSPAAAVAVAIPPASGPGPQTVTTTAEVEIQFPAGSVIPAFLSGPWKIVIRPDGNAQAQDKVSGNDGRATGKP